MALKDLKSDLSKFRMPKKDPLENKHLVSVNKTANKTPLSSMVESAPKIPRSQTTTNKEGVNPKNMDNTAKFLGETAPTPSNNSEKFLGETATKPMSLEERYLGETTQTAFDNNEHFLGETTPAVFDNTSKFLGETNPTKFDNKEHFLGETTPSDSDNTSKFLGETTQTPSNNTSKFLGETTPTDSDSSAQFLGETEPNEANNESQFLGETEPSEANNESKFLGETTPNSANNESRFLGETTQTPSNNTSRFLGETTPNSANTKSRFLGETTPNKVTSKPNHSDNGKSFKEVNYFQDIHASGFNSKFAGVESTKFVGVNSNNTKFDNTNSLHSNIDKSKFSTGKNYLKSYEDAGGSNSGEEGFGLGKGHAKRHSPSFLDDQYSKFNLRDDAHNTGMTAFDHPLILRGIQRKGKKGNEPQNFGIPGTNIDLDDGLIRGGIITSTTRAVIDAIRLGKWMVSIKGLLWGVKQFGLQQSNPNVEKIGAIRRTKMWTPINTLASAIGAHIGFHPNRHGFTPFDIKKGGYEGVQNAKAVLGAAGDIGLGLSPLPSLLTDNRLVALYGESFKLGRNGFNESQSSKNPTGGWLFNSISLGGTNSVYGLIPNGKFPYRNEDTRDKTIVTKPNIIVERDRTIYYKTKYSPYTIFNQYGRESEAGIIIKAPNSTDQQANHLINSPSEDDQIFDTERLSGLFKYGQPGKSDDSIYAFGGGGIPKEDVKGATLIARNALGQDIGYTRDAGETIRSYETIAYGNIPNRVAGETSDIDFRSLLTGNENDRSLGNSKDDPKIDTTKNIATRVGFQNPGAIGISENRTDWGNTDSTANGFLNRFDKVNAAEQGADVEADLVHLWFQIPKTTTRKTKQVDSGKVDDPKTKGIDESKKYKFIESDADFKDRLAEVIKEGRVQFRGTVSGITDTFSPSWNAIKYNGRADQAYQYSTFERSLSFSFKVYATSRSEMKPIYKKLAYLASMTMPQYGGSHGYNGALIRFRLGDLFRNRQAFIESLSYSMSDDTPWDIDIDKDNPLGELPMGIDVSIGLKILGSKPHVGARVYDASFMA